MEDTKIVDLYLARDEAAVAETASKYGLRLRGIARRLLDSEPAAEECENDTYLEAWNRIPPHEPRTYLFPFLGKITRHLAIDECRRRESLKRQALFCELTAELEECLPGGSDVEGDVAAEELGRTVTAFLMTCTEEQRSLFILRYWYFQSVPEIAAACGVSRSKVKTTLFRLRERLRQYLEKEGYEL